MFILIFLKAKDCVHVWQFCRDLLNDSSYNPKVIEWLDQRHLVFKINNKEEIAFLWGLKKNRKSPEKMTYENMSRGMRYVHNIIKIKSDLK
jgi:hypothetical protein